MDEKIKILVVDDSATMRRIIRISLKRLGCEVYEARNGIIALDLLREEEFDLIMSDWDMPVMDGMGLLEKVRSGQAGCHSKVPFVMITAKAESTKILEAINAGISHYIVKPFTAEILEEKLDKVFRRPWKSRD